MIRAALGAGGLLLGGACASDAQTAPGAPVAEPTAFVVTRWAADPWAGGSYSFLARGSTPEDRRILASPVADRMLFAGEASSSDFPATVHGALLSGRDAAAQAIDAGAETIVVIGAGAAGLAAASVLAGEGIGTVVVEARDRIGGRVWTDDAIGFTVDLGASWIHGVDGNPLTDLADEAGADLHPFDYDDVDFHEVGDDEEAFEITSSIEHEFAADLDELNPDAGEEGEELGGGDALIPSGYATLLQVLAEDVEDLRLGTPVTDVVIGDAGVVVTGDWGQVAADGVIVTVPLGVLKAGAIAFDPPLPSSTAGAIDRLGMGLLNKVVITFDEPFWPAQTALINIVPERPGEWVEWVNLMPVTGIPALMGFNAGSVARRFEALDDDALLASAMDALRAAYG